MRALILSSLFALGLGLAATPASAAPIADINAAVSGQAMVDQAQYYYRPRHRHRVRCNNVRVCRMTPYGRRCHVERVCRRW
jgi:hypothetical protein